MVSVWAPDARTVRLRRPDHPDLPLARQGDLWTTPVELQPGEAYVFVLGDVLGVLLVLAGLAVTPLYINAYLMMDEDLPPHVLHEANTWVPVGNNVGYTIGIVVAGTVSDRGTDAVAVCLSIVAFLAAAYGVVSLFGKRTQETRSVPSEGQEAR